jgi:pyruvate,water dikinase
MAHSGRGVLCQRLFRWVLENTRLGVRNREEMRLARTKIFDVFRSMLRSIGATFEREGVLARADDIFFLSADEMWAYIKGASFTTDLRALVSLRRRQYDAWRDPTFTPPPRRFETCGLPYREYPANEPTQSEPTSQSLHGLGGCPGVVVGAVEVVRDPRTARFEGQILVAEQTDPGWTAIFPAYAGLLVERGSVLSHSMIVAREFGLPAVVNVENLTRRLRTGDRVRMDGRAGTIEILPSRIEPNSDALNHLSASVAVSST